MVERIGIDKGRIGRLLGVAGSEELADGIDGHLWIQPRQAEDLDVVLLLHLRQRGLDCGLLQRPRQGDQAIGLRMTETRTLVWPVMSWPTTARTAAPSQLPKG